MNRPKFTVDSIRPDSLKKLQKYAKEADLEWLSTKFDSFVEGHCPICGGDSDSKIIYNIGNKLHYNICNDCNTLFLGTRPDKNAYDEFYNISKTMKLFATHIFKESYVSRLNNIYKPRLQLMLQYFGKFSTQKGKFLEIGAGSGVFSQLVNETKVFSDCIVIEPSPYLADSCRQKGLNTIQRPVEDVCDTNLFSDTVLASCFELLEHLTDPAAFLKNLFSLLPDGALFCLTTPNGQGFDILELKERSTTLGLTHINLFNPASLGRLLNKIGFKVLDIATPGSLDVDLVYRDYITNGVDPYKSWLHHFLLTATEDMKQHFQDFIVSSKESSHMWAICQK